MATHETTVHKPERAGVRSFHFAKIKEEHRGTFRDICPHALQKPSQSVCALRLDFLGVHSKLHAQTSTS